MSGLPPLDFYIAAPLYSEGERAFNLRLDGRLRNWGLTTYLPQRDGGYLEDLVATGHDETAARHLLFATDIAALERCNALLIVLDGRAIDEGACVELGYAFAKGKPCVGFKTDPRSNIRGRLNVMVEGVCSEIATTWPDLERLALMIARRDDATR